MISNHHANKHSFSQIVLPFLILALFISCTSESTPPYIDNHAPVLDSLVVMPNDSIGILDTVIVVCYVTDPDDDPLTYEWSAQWGGLIDANCNAVPQEGTTTGNPVRWAAGETLGEFPISVTITDKWNASITHSSKIYVIEGEASNQPPEILSFEAELDTIAPRDTVRIFAEYLDPDDPQDSLQVDWYYSGGRALTIDSHQMIWISPGDIGRYKFSLSLSDGFHIVRDSLYIYVGEPGSFNNPPAIESVRALKPDLVVNDSTLIICSAADPDNDPITYRWSSDFGRFSGGGQQIMWTSPDSIGEYTINVTVSDDKALSAYGFTRINVVPDTVIYYQTDFSSNDVDGNWFFQGMLTGLGDNIGSHPTISWDSEQEKMAITARSNNGTFGFRLRQLSFGDGSFRVTVRATNSQFSRIGFLPKFLGESNYLIISINLIQPFLEIIRCVSGEKEYLCRVDKVFLVDQDYHLFYAQFEDQAWVKLDGEEIWRGDVIALFTVPQSLGVAVNGAQDSERAFFDDIRVSNP